MTTKLEFIVEAFISGVRISVLLSKSLTFRVLTFMVGTFMSEVCKVPTKVSASSCPLIFMSLDILTFPLNVVTPVTNKGPSLNMLTFA